MRNIADKGYYETPDVCGILDCSKGCLQRWRREGVGPEWTRLEGRILYPVKAFHEYLQNMAGISE